MEVNLAGKKLSVSESDIVFHILYTDFVNRIENTVKKYNKCLEKFANDLSIDEINTMIRNVNNESINTDQGCMIILTMEDEIYEYKYEIDEIVDEIDSIFSCYASRVKNYFRENNNWGLQTLNVAQLIEKYQIDYLKKDYNDYEENRKESFQEFCKKNIEEADIVDDFEWFHDETIKKYDSIRGCFYFLDFAKYKDIAYCEGLNRKLSLEYKKHYKNQKKMEELRIQCKKETLIQTLEYKKHYKNQKKRDELCRQLEKECHFFMFYYIKKISEKCNLNIPERYYQIENYNIYCKERAVIKANASTIEIDRIINNLARFPFDTKQYEILFDRIEDREGELSKLAAFLRIDIEKGRQGCFEKFMNSISKDRLKSDDNIMSVCEEVINKSRAINYNGKIEWKQATGYYNKVLITMVMSIVAIMVFICTCDDNMSIGIIAFIIVYVLFYRKVRKAKNIAKRMEDYEKIIKGLQTANKNEENEH